MGHGSAHQFVEAIMWFYSQYYLNDLYPAEPSHLRTADKMHLNKSKNQSIHLLN